MVICVGQVYLLHAAAFTELPQVGKQLSLQHAVTYLCWHHRIPMC